MKLDTSGFEKKVLFTDFIKLSSINFHHQARFIKKYLG
ncbi:hypothetical protein LEP1GSC132_2983 [Leptospira kirschneri str. 200803703]|uniref:Uncharacterized protein n=1 Tax=Leptospira kirschneri str. 200802841 TaxID=1193047 RepID=A0A828Y3C6_9LEPT|nr:hypothetical protein LEP1GSC044_0674 [Leptospira kirschneri serovar Grippotyphosa str. RM52]EKO49574.1 hypothetical protein LEP1GSC131_0182 [Leptospira kirschneri str. 200802841]EKQ84283.1 hypothetical protein LEP1GSC064_3295 [Leptospira kirschneri serovar Grippotyphosa str. Moskva]EKR06614.1 hypothetical protein LEP1GSC122_1269 [Leptospira kirschneri serovar Valbuzzi str. 200702274]EMK06404.1 hypothetical protein LEP1GSC176_0903 [Leptospira kirschneri str. MMD1493]EMK18308.1 hypothetical p